MERMLAVTTILSLVLLVIVLYSLRRSHIRVEYSVSWLAAAAFLLILSRSDTVLRWIGDRLGIHDPPSTLLFLAVCVFAIVFYRFSIMISHLKDSNIALTQKVAILEHRLRHLHEKEGSAASR
jgi:hypothetical protein